MAGNKEEAVVVAVDEVGDGLTSIMIGGSLG
jgi:hypothetical protein